MTQIMLKHTILSVNLTNVRKNKVQARFKSGISIKFL